MDFLSRLFCRSASAASEPSKHLHRAPDKPPSPKTVSWKSDAGAERQIQQARLSDIVSAELLDFETDDEMLNGRAAVPHVDRNYGLLPATKFRKPRPDRLSRRQHLERCYKQAYLNATVQSIRPICHGRLTLVCLVLVQFLRIAAFLDNQTPGLAVCALHFLALSSDILALVVTTPLFCCQTLASCVQGGRAGLMLTLVFALCCVDVGALVAYCCVGSPKPFSPGRITVLKVAEAYLDMWEMTLIASVALHVGLFACCWRIYRELRENGLYPGTSAPIGFGPLPQPISAFEVLCEIEDVNRIRKGEYSLCNKGMGQPTAGKPRLDTTP